MSTWQYAPVAPGTPPNSVVFRTLDNGQMESRSVNDPEVTAWIAAGNSPLPASAPPAPTFLSRDLMAQLTAPDYAAIRSAIASSAPLGLLWASMLAQGEAPIDTSTQRFEDGWAGLQQALGNARATEIATALGFTG